MQLVMTTNNARDHLLLINDDGLIVSDFDVTKQALKDYLHDGDDADEWDVQESGGIEIDGLPARIDDYGDVVGRNGKIDSAVRREFYRVEEIEAEIERELAK